MKKYFLIPILLVLLATISVRSQIPTFWYLDVVTPNDVSLNPNYTSFTEGTKSCQLNLLLPNVPYLICNDFPVVPGTPYTFSIDVFDNDPRGYLKLYCDFRSATGGNIWGENPVVVNDNQNWQTISWSANVPANAAKGYVLIKFYHSAGFVNLATALVDNCKFMVGSSNLVLNGGYEDWGGVNIPPVGAANNSSATFRFINPAVFPLWIQPTVEVDRIEILDVAGRLVMTTPMNERGEVVIESGQLRGGVYMVTGWKANQLISAEKLIVP